MSGFLIRLFATNGKLGEDTDGRVAQTEFDEHEIKELRVKQVKAYTSVEGEVVKTANGGYYGFSEKSLDFQIETPATHFSNFAEIEELEQFLSRKYIYIATRWVGQGTEMRYPRSIPDDNAKAQRIIISKISVENEDGYLILRIEAKAKKW